MLADAEDLDVEDFSVDASDSIDLKQQQLPQQSGMSLHIGTYALSCGIIRTQLNIACILSHSYLRYSW